MRPAFLKGASACQHHTFSLHADRRLWWVETGYVDVFAVATQDPGTRRHLLRMPPGGALFSAPLECEATQLLAVAGPDTQVLVADVPWSAELAGLVDFWVEGVSLALGDHEVPRDSQVLQAGDALDLEPGAVASARGPIGWIRASHGGFTFLALTEPVVGPSQPPVPLTRHSWVKASGPTRLQAQDTGSLFRERVAEHALGMFHRLVLASLTGQQARFRQQDRERSETQARSEGQAVATALGDLVSILGAGRPECTPGTQEPLLAACRAVGDACGIAIRPARPDAAQADPLGEICRVSHFHARRVVLRREWWKDDNGPLLGYRQTDQAPVALIPESPTRYAVIDPTAAVRRKVDAAVAQDLSPVAHQFYRPFPPHAMTPWKLLRFAMRGCRRDLVVTAFIGVVSGVLGLLVPVVTGILIDASIPSADREQVFLLGLGLVAVAVSSATFGFARAVAAQRLEGKMDIAVQAAVWDRILSLPMSFFRTGSAGDLAMRAQSIDSMQQTLTGSSVSAMLGAIFSLFSVGLMVYYNAGLALLALLPLVVLASATVLAGLVQVRLDRPMLETQGRISGLVLQLLNGIAKIRVAGAEGRAFARWGRDFARQKLYAWRSMGVGNHLSVTNAMFSPLAAMLLFLGVSHTTQGAPASMTPGDFLAFYAAFGQCTAALLALSGALTSTVMAVPLYERARPILEAQSEFSELRPAPGMLRGELELSHVTFRYGTDGPTVLQDVTLRAAPGEWIAIVGPSGGGKSTLLRLLLGLEAPEAGAVYFDGQDLQNIDVQAVRRQMGVVLQSGRLMPGSILDNIVGSSGRSLDEAWEAARLAGLEADIQSMPMGMQTVIMEGGSAFSGGQRQRLLIARALVNRPRVLLFDEATSALDSETQEVVTQNLESLRATRIVIAHRLSTIRLADRIYVLDGGKMVQSGTYEELVRQGGTFENLVRPQLLPDHENRNVTR